MDTAIYLSHSADKHDDPDWWIVEPRDDPHALARQIHSLLSAGRGRTVLRIDVGPLPSGYWPHERVTRVTLDSVPWPEVEG
jgi:hypothetical protein